MYHHTPPRDEPDDYYRERALTFLDMFAGNGAGVTEHSPRADYAVDFYNLAHAFWFVITYLADQALDPADRFELVVEARAAERSFKERFPNVFPKDLVRGAFDALVYLIEEGAWSKDSQCSTGLRQGAIRNAYARATWLRNALHNVYLEETNFPLWARRGRKWPQNSEHHA